LLAGSRATGRRGAIQQPRKELQQWRRPQLLLAQFELQQQSQFEFRRQSQFEFRQQSQFQLGQQSRFEWRFHAQFKLQQR
jgi:hypothetical protein